MCVTWFAYAAIHGWMRSTSAASPPRNVASVPAFAPPAPPDTGASTQPTPALRSRRAASRAVSGWIVEWSTIRLPRFAPSATPRGPNTTASTASPSVTHRKTASHCAASSAGDAAADAPASSAG